MTYLGGRRGRPSFRTPPPAVCPRRSCGRRLRRRPPRSWASRTRIPAAVRRDRSTRVPGTRWPRPWARPTATTTARPRPTWWQRDRRLLRPSYYARTSTAVPVSIRRIWTPLRRGKCYFQRDRVLFAGRPCAVHMARRRRARRRPGTGVLRETEKNNMKR